MLRTTLASLVVMAIATASLSARVWYVAVGDSITEGTGDETFRGGYPPRLQALLQAQGVDAQIDNRGVGGETTIGAMNRIDAIIENGGDVLLLMEGTNDITRHVSTETLLFNLGEMARRAEAGGFGVVHSTLIPRLPDARVDPHNQINELVAGMIRGLATEMGRPYADPFREFLSLSNPFLNYYWDDENDPVGHPNAAGYDVLASNYLAPAMSPCFLGSGISAMFALSSDGGGAPVEVEFTDLSPAAVTSWFWDFEDDGVVDSNVQHPVFTYSEEGTYSVRLRISNGQCTATHLIKDAVTVLPRPKVPEELTAEPISASAIALTWIDNTDDETFFQLEGKTGTGEFDTIAFLPADSTSYLSDGLEEHSYYAFRIRSGNLGGSSDFSDEASATTYGLPASCSFTDEELCLADGRLVAWVEWRDHHENRGVGHASQLSGESGTFWFFDAENLELVVKGLDATADFGYLWTFYGSLTDVEFVLTVMETETGVTRSYVNPRGNFASVGDTESFPGSPLDAQSIEGSDLGSTAVCTEDAAVLCLRDGRFEVRIAWSNQLGESGLGTAIPANDTTGFFWFKNASNTELAVKVLKFIDPTTEEVSFWVFSGALSDVEYTMTVDDTLTGDQRIYFNPAGTMASFGDTEAFPVGTD